MMRRSPLKPGAGFKSQALARGERIEAREVSKLKRTVAMKSKSPRMTPIRKSARNEACTLRFPCCCGDPATVVWCHSNHAVDGKGAGLKARDEEGAYGCHTCHSWLDGGYASHMPRSLVDKYFDLARTERQQILRRKGLML